MPAVVEVAPALVEQTPEADFEVARAPESTADIDAELHGLEQAYEQPAVNEPHADTAESRLHSISTAGTARVEMPASHGDVDPESLTATGLIKACKYFAELAAKNPARAHEEADKVIQARRQEAAMRRDGMNEQEIRSQKFAASRERLQARLKARETTESKPKPEKTHEDEMSQEERLATTARAIGSVAHTPEGESTATIQAQAHLAETEARADTAKVLGNTETEASHPANQEHGTSILAQPELELHTAYDTYRYRNDTEDVEMSEAATVTAIEANNANTSDAAKSEPIETTPITPEKAPINDTLIDSEHEKIEHEESQAEPTELPPPDDELTNTLQHDDVSAEVNDVTAAESPAANAISQFVESANTDNPPLEIYDAFTEAIQKLADTPTMPLTPNEVGNPTTISREAEAESLQPMPPIMTKVAERLPELEAEEKEAVVPMLQEIASAIDEVTLLSKNGSQEINSETLAAAETKLEELCATLFETLGIDYDKQDIEQFARTVLHPALRPLLTQPVEQELDLEHLGTHEVKLHLSQVINDIADIDLREPLRKLVGTFALLRATFVSPSEA